MGLLSFLSDCFGIGGDAMSINPGSGLPMLDSGIDIAGNLFGFGSSNFDNSGPFDPCSGSDAFGAWSGSGVSSFD